MKFLLKFKEWIYFSFFKGDSADKFEDISKNVKSEATRPQQDTLRDRPAPDSEYILAEEQKPLFGVFIYFFLSLINFLLLLK
jgi:hypothetical protein